MWHPPACGSVSGEALGGNAGRPGPAPGSACRTSASVSLRAWGAGLPPCLTPALLLPIVAVAFSLPSHMLLGVRVASHCGGDAQPPPVQAGSGQPSGSERPLCHS